MARRRGQQSGSAHCLPSTLPTGQPPPLRRRAAHVDRSLRIHARGVRSAAGGGRLGLGASSRHHPALSSAAARRPRECLPALLPPLITKGVPSGTPTHPALQRGRGVCAGEPHRDAAPRLGVAGPQGGCWVLRGWAGLGWQGGCRAVRSPSARSCSCCTRSWIQPAALLPALPPQVVEAPAAAAAARKGKAPAGERLAEEGWRAH